MTVDYKELEILINDYPKEGIVFRDLMPVFANAGALSNAVDTLAEQFSELRVTHVLSPEARGFILGAPVAYCLGAGFVAARKPGKLPRETYSESYDLEYGSTTLEILTDALKPGDRVLIIDDLLATGGTATSLVKLATDAGAEVVGLGFFVELSDLNPEEQIEAVTDAPIYSMHRE
ncbi:MAG: adenine phosphoribosyltransferase [Eggerthellaceae bacterium]|nr:adenine phosphoribosyltransferase [Eggerthellaceae bacterium]